MYGLSRRDLLAGLAYTTARPASAARGGSQQSAQAALLLSHTNVRAFGAKGNGLADDTRAIQAAVAAAPPGGTVLFPPGTYVVSKTIVLKSGTTYRGSNASSSVIKRADHAKMIAVMADENFVGNQTHTSSGIQIEDLRIDGNATHNTGGHGLLLMVDRSLVRHVLVDFPPEAGIVLTNQNRSGALVKNPAVENRIEDCTVTQPGTYGIWVVDTHHSGSQTDGYLLNNVVKNSLGAWALRIERAAGWFIANNHVYHCAQNGIFLSHVECTYFYCNEVDHFGLTKSPPGTYYGLQVQFSMGRLRPSIFIGNVCATWEGRNPHNLYTYFDFGGDGYGRSTVILVGNATHNDPMGNPLLAHSSYGSTAFQYDVQPGGALDVSKVANTDAGALTFESVPGEAHIQFGGVGAQPTHMPVTSELVAGVAGGAVVGGINLAARNRRARERGSKLLGSRRFGTRGRSDDLSVTDVAETLSRSEIDPLDFAPAVGTIHLTYFVPFQDIEVTQITSATGNRPVEHAALSRVGLYEVLEDGSLELLGASRNGAGRFWAIPHSITTVDLAYQFGPLPLRLIAGRPYAYAEIQVGGSPATRVGKVGNPALMALEPRESARYPGYRDLAPSLPPPSEANASGMQLYARLTGGGLADHDDYRSEMTGPADLERDHA